MRGCDKVYFCKCGRKIKGPTYFKHLKLCGKEKVPDLAITRKSKTIGKGHLKHKHTCPKCRETFIGNGFYSHLKKCAPSQANIKFPPAKKATAKKASRKPIITDSFKGFTAIVSLDPAVKALNEVGYVVMTVHPDFVGLLEASRKAVNGIVA